MIVVESAWCQWYVKFETTMKVGTLKYNFLLQWYKMWLQIQSKGRPKNKKTKQNKAQSQKNQNKIKTK